MKRSKIFISAVTQEFGSTRQIVADALLKLGHTPIRQEIFGTEEGDLREGLRRQIDSCAGIIQIVGHAYGAEPPSVDPEFGRVSYTQFEFHYARKKGQKIWLIFPAPGSLSDLTAEQLDLPRDPSISDPGAWQAERRDLQMAYREMLRGSGLFRHKAEGDAELKLKIAELKSELRRLDRSFRTWQWLVAGGITLILLLVCAMFLIQWRQFEDPELTRERVQVHLLATVNQTLDRELAEAGTKPTEAEREKARNAALDEHDRRLSRLGEIADIFAELEGKREATDAFRGMKRILAKRGVEAAQEYIVSKRDSILDRARNTEPGSKRRAVLEPLLQSAKLLWTEGESEQSRAAFREIIELEPDWLEALESFIWPLHELDAQEAIDVADRLLAIRRQMFDAKPDDPATALDVAYALARLGQFQLERRRVSDVADGLKSYDEGLKIYRELLGKNPTNRLVAQHLAFALSNLGHFLALRGGEEDVATALTHYNESHGLFLRLADGAPATGKARRNLAASYDNLGDFARTHNLAPGKALGFYEKGLELREQIAEANPNSGAAKRDLTSSLQRISAALFKRNEEGDIAQAIAHGERGYEIAKSLAAANPDNLLVQRDMAVALEHFGSALVASSESEDQERGLAHLNHRLELGKNAAQADSNAQSLRDLLAAHQNLLFAYEKLGRPEDAYEQLKACDELLDRFEREGWLQDAQLKAFHAQIKAALTENPDN